MDTTQKVARLSSDMDATRTRRGPHPGEPEGWPVSAVADALYAVLRANPDTRAGIARRLDLNLSEVDAMEHLMRDPIGPVELSRLLHMTSASATVLVDRLEEAGHVHREPDPHDRRRRVVRPTQHGTQAVFEQIGPMVADLVAVEEDMTEHDRDVVVAYLQRVLGVLQRHGDVDRPAPSG
jgi:DNA-binding MarR family transcriptional regulator